MPLPKLKTRHHVVIAVAYAATPILYGVHPAWWTLLLSVLAALSLLYMALEHDIHDYFYLKRR